MKKYIKYLFVVVAVCIVFGIASNTDAATTAKIHLGNRYWVTSKGEYSESYANHRGTFYKSINDSNAYCVQAAGDAPPEGTSYSLVGYGKVQNIDWNVQKAIKSAMIQKKIYETYQGHAGYVYVYAALNTFLNINGSETYHNSVIDPIIDEVKRTAVCTETQFNPSGMVNFRVSSDKFMTYSQSGNNKFYYAKVDLALPTGYCGADINYKVSLNNSNAKMYTSKSFNTEFNGNISGKNSYSFYVKIPFDKISAGDDLKVSVRATNKITYPVARLWKSSSKYQMVVTSDKSLSISRSMTRSTSMTVEPIEPNKYNFVINKVDSDGNSLSGANLTFSVYTDSGFANQVGTCSISPNGAKPYKCTINYTRDGTLAAVSKFYYKVTEITPPAGYIKVDDISGSFDATGSSNLCYVVSTDGTLTATDISDCNNTYNQSGVCKVNDSYDFNVAQESCVSDVVEEGSTEPGVVRAWENKCIANGNTIVDDSKCNNVYMKETVSGNSFGLSITNTKNSVNFSKQDINGNELEGATLKVCSTKPNKNGECTVVRNTMDGVCSNNDLEADENDTYTGFKNCVYDRNTDTKTVDMEWVSSSTPMLWEGLASGKYYLVETLPAPGYKLNSSVVEFNVDNEGNITSKNYDKDNNVIVIKNELNSLTISKTDVASSKELPGAQLSICAAEYDEESDKYVSLLDDGGECLPASVVDGGTDGKAIWTSTEEPHKISGLAAGTYYLVERTSPDGYDTAESILFVMNNDGTLSDIEGNSLADNKLVMEDKPLEQIKTGDIILLVVGVLAVIGAGVGFVIYKNKTGGFSDNSFIGKIIKKFKK